MSGIYIHIPFCRRKCHYCNFFSVASEKLKKGFMDALYREIELKKDYLGDEAVKTIYIGGGTPSVLNPYEIEDLLFAIYKLFEVDEGAEITIEVNPDDVDKQWVNALRETQANRVSIGVQSFNDADLHYLSRLHDARSAIGAVELLKAAGYENTSIDLIYGLPTLDDKHWRQNLERFIDLDLPHLSAYALTVEPRTALHLLIEKQKLPAVDDQRVASQFRILQEMTSKHGYIHYEISNFSREGFYSKHNSIYWLGGHYLGLGPSAHSYNGHSRQWNVSSITRYLNDQNAGKETFEIEYLNEQQRYNEYVMTALRTVWGCDLEHIENVFGKPYREHCIRQASPFMDNGRLERDGNKVFLTVEGKIFADGIAAGLFWV